MYKSDFELTNTEAFDASNDGYDFYREENPNIHIEESEKLDAYLSAIQSIKRDVPSVGTIEISPIPSVSTGLELPL